MKKLIFLLVFSFLLISCKIDNEKWKESLESVASGGSEAAEIVAYNNALIKLSDNQHGYIQSLNGNLNRIADKLLNLDDPYAYLSLTPLIYTNIQAYNDPDPEKPGSAFEKEDKEFFEKNVLAMNELFRAIQNDYSKLDEYIKAEDFKDDQGKAGNEMISQIDQLVEKYYDTNKIITDKIVMLSEKAEWEVLKTHPFKDHIFAMKDASNAVADFVTFAYDNPENYGSNESKFKELYEKIEAFNAQRETLASPQNSAYPGKEIYFSQYNKAVTDFLIEARKIMRDAAASGNLTQNNLNDLAREEENMRMTYNNFVD